MKQEVKKFINNWRKFQRLNDYYHHDLKGTLRHLVPHDASVLEFGSKDGEILIALPNKKKIGVEKNIHFLEFSKKEKARVKIVDLKEISKSLKNQKFDYIVLSHFLSSTADIQRFINLIRIFCHQDTRIVVVFFNFFWKPFLDLAEKANLKFPEAGELNWLSGFDVDNLFNLESFEKIHFGQRFLVPYKIPFVSDFINRFLSPLPVVNNFSLLNYSIFRLRPKPQKYSVSVIIPARNEEGNIKGVLRKIPRLGTKTEVIFVEGHSTDQTFKAIKKELENYQGPIEASVYRQKGKGKGDAVRLGFSRAKNELLMILDADLTVDPKELPKFYNACAQGLGDLVMGTRLVYPMERMAMRNLNYLGNKFFSIAFTFLLSQKIRDTLCGTKVILRSNYLKIEKNRKIFGDFDPFGDFDLIFGAAKLNLKIMEIPIRYHERFYGKTNISRFSHGLLLFKMVYFAAKNLKFFRV